MLRLSLDSVSSCFARQFLGFAQQRTVATSSPTFGGPSLGYRSLRDYSFLQVPFLMSGHLSYPILEPLPSNHVLLSKIYILSARYSCNGQ